MKNKAPVFLILMAVLLSACGASCFDPCGEYVDDMGSDLIIAADENGGYSVDYSIYKLAYIDNASGVYDEKAKILSFEGTDYDGNVLAASVNFSDGEPVVTLTKSAYNDCPVGTVFEFQKK